MRVVEQLLGPGVQDGEHADRRPDMARIAGEFDDGLPGGLHQQGVAVTLVGAQRVAEFLGHGHGDVEIARRQHLGLAGREPALGLVGMAFGTATVLARAIGEDLGGALVATPEAAAESLGSAGLDVGDDAPMRRRHRGAMSRQVLVGEAAKDVRDLDHDHDGPAASEAGHQSVEDASERNAGRFGEVGVDGGRGDVNVTEQDLHDPGVDAAFEQPRRIAVTQGVGRDSPRDPRRASGVLKAAAQHVRVGRGAGMIGEEPAWIAVGLPKLPQAIQDRLWQRYAPLPVALADDAKLQIGAVDGADFQCRGLAYAQPTGVHESKAGFVNGIPHAAQQRSDLLVRQDLGKSQLLGRANSFF